MQTLGKLIRARRRACDITQAQLAQKLGVTRVTVNCWERDRKVPRLRDITLVSQALGITPSQLLDGLGQEKEVSNEKEIPHTTG